MPEGTQETILTLEDVEGVASGAVEDVNTHVDARTDILGGQLDGIDNTLSVRLGAIDDGLAALSSDLESATPTDETVYVVRLDPSQVETASGVLRILCTEGLLLVVAVSVCAGLLAWQTFTRRWL